MAAHRQPPLPVSLQWGRGEGRRVFRGGEGPPHVGGPTRRRGTRSSSRVFQAQTEARFSCLGTRLAGGEGGGQGEAAHSLSKERASGSRGRGLTQPDSPGCRLFGQRLSWESGGQEAQGKEASLCGAKNRGAEALSLPKPESLITAFGECPGGRRGPSCLPGAGQGPSCLPRTKGKPRPQASLPQKGPSPAVC